MKRTGCKQEERKREEGINKLTTVRGIVVPVDWDEEGNALVAAISASDEYEYVIERDEKGKELLKLIKHEIEASGIVREAVKGCKAFTVKSYKLKTGDN